MYRTFSSTRTGSGFTETTIQQVWEKGKPDPNYDARHYRRDSCGALISRQLYGKTVPNGWEVDHIIPVASNGSDDLSNLQPLQWENNRHKSDQIEWTCKVIQ